MKLLSLILALLLIPLLTQAFVCKKTRMEHLANRYLFAQVDHDWSEVFAAFDPNIEIYSNVAKEPSATDSTTAQQVLGTIGFVFQSIDAVVAGPVNTFRPNDVTAYFTKTQRDLLSGFAHNITFYHTLTFRQGVNFSDCVITRIEEFADGLKTVEVFPLLAAKPFALLCLLLDEKCASDPVDYGSGRNCYDHYRDAPLFVRDSQLRIIQNSHSLACVTRLLTSLNPTTAPFLCPLFGLPITGVDGCW